MLPHKVPPIMDDDYLAVTSQSSLFSSLYQLVWKDEIMIVILMIAVSFFLLRLLGSFSDSVARPRVGYYSSWLLNQLLLLRNQANLYSEISKEVNILCLKNITTRSVKSNICFAHGVRGSRHVSLLGFLLQNCNKKAQNPKLHLQANKKQQRENVCPQAFS